MTESIFTKIINRELPAHFIYEDDDCIVILDRFPAVKGQTVVIPKKEIDYAINKGDLAKKYLHKIVFNLNQVNEWGFQGRVKNSSSMLRKSKAIQKEMYVANKFLQKYEDQLHDITVHFNVNFEKQIKNLEAFLDRFLDDLITDWIVNNKIQNSVNMVASMMDTITKLNGSLEFHKSKVEKYLEEDIDLKGHLILEFIKKTT